MFLTSLKKRKKERKKETNKQILLAESTVRTQATDGRQTTILIDIKNLFDILGATFQTNYTSGKSLTTDVQTSIENVEVAISMKIHKKISENPNFKILKRKKFGD